MTRREIMTALLALTVAPAAFAGRASVAARSDSACEIGRWLLSHGGFRSDRAQLTVALDPVRAAGTWSAAARADFAAGRVVPVAGWQISETEARLCALAALDAGVRSAT